MSAKLDIIRNLHHSIDTHQVECQQFRQELHDKNKELYEAISEVYLLKDRNLLQHSSWMLCEQLNREKVAKLNKNAAHLNHLLDVKVGRIFDLEEQIEGIQKRAANRSRLQRFVAKLFKL